MSAHEFHHCEHTPLGPPPIDTAEQIRQGTAEGEKAGAMLSGHLRTTPTPIDPDDIRALERVRAMVKFWECELDSRCPSCRVDVLSGCDHLEGYHHALSDMRKALADPDAEAVTSQTSDGYHTFAELYEYRMLYNAHAAHGWLASGIPVVKSWHHSDGEPCFGGGWFVVVATLPTGQVSNHYKSEHWGLFDVPEVSLPPEYDGHTPADAAARLHEALRAES